MPDAPIFLMSQNIFAARSAAHISPRSPSSPSVCVPVPSVAAQSVARPRISPRIFPSVVAPIFFAAHFPRTPMPEPFFRRTHAPFFRRAHDPVHISPSSHAAARSAAHIKQGRFSRPFFFTSYTSSLVLQNSSPVLHIVYSYFQTSFYSSYSFLW